MQLVATNKLEMHIRLIFSDKLLSFKFLIGLLVNCCLLFQIQIVILDPSSPYIFLLVFHFAILYHLPIELIFLTERKKSTPSFSDPQFMLMNNSKQEVKVSYQVKMHWPSLT